VVIEPFGRRRLDYGASLLFVALAAIVSGLPGALMILASRPLYDGHAHGVAEWGLTLVQDQQLGGLIMWVPAGFMYLAAISILFVLWLQEAERRSAVRLQRAARLVGLAALLVLGGCEEAGVATRFSNIGDPERGAVQIEQIGCGSCHMIPGIDGAQGLVGPPLDHMGRRIFVAGLLRNTPENMVKWLRDPQDVVPGNAMPDMGITEEQARDITAYLYTLD
jgi:putative membrane protein